MAFSADSMVLWAYGDGAKLYFYNAGADAVAAVKGASYFDSFASQVDVGDLIFVEASDGRFFRRVSAKTVTSVATASLNGQAAIADTAGATYTAAEQTMLNNLKAAVNSLLGTTGA